MNWFLRRLVSWWVRFKVRPEEAAGCCVGAVTRSRLRPGAAQRGRPCRAAEACKLTGPAAARQTAVPRLAGAAQLPPPHGPAERAFGGAHLDRRPPTALARMIKGAAAMGSAGGLRPGARRGLVGAGRRSASPRWVRLLLVDDCSSTRPAAFLQVVFNARSARGSWTASRSPAPAAGHTARRGRARAARRAQPAGGVRAPSRGAHRPGSVASAHADQRGPAHARGTPRRGRRCARHTWGGARRCCVRAA